jgi:WD40 repeat protein
VKHRQPVTAVVLSKDSDKGFSASKDGVIVHWDVETGKNEKYLWPSENVLVSHHAKTPLSAKRSKHVLALAVSSDGRYLASGGLDRHIHLWDVRSREHIQVLNDSHLSILLCYFEIWVRRHSGWICPRKNISVCCMHDVTFSSFLKH